MDGLANVQESYEGLVSFCFKIQLPGPQPYWGRGPDLFTAMTVKE